MQKGNNMRIQLFILTLLTCFSTRRAYTNPDVPAQQTVSQITQQPASDAKLPSPAKKNGPIKLNNAHEVEQKVIVTQPKKDPTDCTQLQGKDLMDCMACQSSENLKKNLMNCNDRMAHYYFVNLPHIEAYCELLQNFTEEEWNLLYESRQIAARENFPKTLEEQRNMLKKLYVFAYYNSNEYLHNFIEYIWCSGTKLSKDSLEKIMYDFHQRCLNGRISSTTHDHLHATFYLERKKLFTRSAR